MIKGRLLSIETMGLVDGPGIRVVVFLKGCPLRCKFCHNPDSWSETGEIVTPDELLKKLLRFKPYFSRSGGGVTFSGGEPLLQAEFLLECLRLCRQNGIHTCVDTSGSSLTLVDEILDCADLVLMDIKAITPSTYRDITGGDIEIAEKFMQKLHEHNTPTVVRQVVIPTVNDTDEYMQELKKYLSHRIPNYLKVELLPYHTLGAHKYETLNLPYPYAHLPAMDKRQTDALYEKNFKE